MKSLIFTFALLTLSAGVEARSILRFETVRKCVTAENPAKSELIVEVQEAQDGQAQLIVTFTQDNDVAFVQAKKILPPPMSAGTPLRYEGKIAELNGKAITLAISARPIKSGKFVGKASSVSIDQLLSNLPMICMNVK